MKKDMRTRISASLVMGAVLSVGVGNVLAGPTSLPLRSEAGTCIYGGSTTQTIETTFGTNLAALPFTGTTTYDFYSPPLTAATTLAASRKGGGIIAMADTSTTSANDFKVTGRMQYADYDPATGSESLIVDTGSSANQDVHHGQTVHWPLPNVDLGASLTVPAGHLLHIVVEIALVEGNPGGFGQLLYNGPSGSTTVGLLPQNSTALQWTFARPGTPTLGLCATPDGCARLTCAGLPGQAYLIQAATSLKAPQWQTIATNCAAADGRFTYLIQDMPNYPCRFYRTSNP
jgi:hypothetical protein